MCVAQDWDLAVALEENRELKARVRELEAELASYRADVTCPDCGARLRPDVFCETCWQKLKAAKAAEAAKGKKEKPK
jgi:cell division septum initiation protein DivIVA